MNENDKKAEVTGYVCPVSSFYKKSECFKYRNIDSRNEEKKWKRKFKFDKIRDKQRPYTKQRHFLYIRWAKLHDRKRKFKKEKTMKILQDETKLKIIETFYSVATNSVLKFSLSTGKFASKILVNAFNENKFYKITNAFFGGIEEYRETLENSCETIIYANYEPDGWISSSTLSQFREYIPLLISSCEKTVVKIPDSGSSKFNVKGNDSSVFYTFSNGFRLMIKNEVSDGVMTNGYYVEWDKIEEVENFVLAQIWEMFKDQSIVVTSDSSELSESNLQSRHRRNSNDQIFIREDNYIGRNESIDSKSQIKTIEKYLAKGKKRSLMYYGPPGTGKSTIANEIIKYLGSEWRFKSLRFEIDDIQHNVVDVKKLTRIFNPDVIVIDDWDRISLTETQMFSIIELLRRNCKLLIFTCNSIAFDPALIRPGRIDQCIPIIALNDEVIRNLLGDDLKDQYEYVKDWPIAFIDELRERAEVIGVDEAVKSINDLLERVELIKKNYKSGMSCEVS